MFGGGFPYEPQTEGKNCSSPCNKKKKRKDISLLRNFISLFDTRIFQTQGVAHPVPFRQPAGQFVCPVGTQDHVADQRQVNFAIHIINNTVGAAPTER